MDSYSAIEQILEAEGDKFRQRYESRMKMFDRYAEPFTKTELVNVPGDEEPHELKTIDTYSMSPEQLDDLEMYSRFLHEAAAKQEIFEDFVYSFLSEEEKAGLSEIPREHPEVLYADMLGIDPKGANHGFNSGQIGIAGKLIDSKPVMSYEEYSDFYTNNLFALLQSEFNLSPEQVKDAVHDYGLREIEPYISKNGGMSL